MQFLDREQQYPLVGIQQVAVGSKPNTVNDFLPGIITMYVLFSISLVAAAINDERKKGTLERLITTRLTIGELFFGKFLASVFRGFIQTFILLALSYAVFRIFTPLTFIESLLIALLFADGLQQYRAAYYFHCPHRRSFNLGGRLFYDDYDDARRHILHNFKGNRTLYIQ